jgi:hypothetical protein
MIVPQLGAILTRNDVKYERLCTPGLLLLMGIHLMTVQCLLVVRGGPIARRVNDEDLQRRPWRAEGGCLARHRPCKCFELKYQVYTT